MAPRLLQRMLCAAALVAVLAVPPFVSACSPITFDSTFVDTLALHKCSDTTPGHSFTCGGDPMTFLEMSITGTGQVEVSASGLNTKNLYELYAVGSATGGITSRTYIGVFVTDTAGAATATVRRSASGTTVNTPSYNEATSGWAAAQVSDIGTLPVDAVIIAFSRGPWSTATGCYNTVDNACDSSAGAADAQLANPDVTDSSMVQFLTCPEAHDDKCNSTCDSIEVTGSDSGDVDLVECSEVHNGSYPWTCGGDPGHDWILDLANATVSAINANAYNLYEVYVLPSLDSPLSDREYFGVFVTDSTGTASNAQIRAPSGGVTSYPPPTPSYDEATSGWPAASTSQLSGLPKDVHFFLFSRGPWGTASCYNTVTNNCDSSGAASSTQLANPDVTDSSMVQFVSCVDPCPDNGGDGDCDRLISGLFFYEPENLLLTSVCKPPGDDCSAPVDTQTRWGWTIPGKQFWERGAMQNKMHVLDNCEENA